MNHRRFVLAAALAVVAHGAPGGLHSNDSLDMGSDLGSPVPLDYFDQYSSRFNGTIDRVRGKYTKQLRRSVLGISRLVWRRVDGRMTLPGNSAHTGVRAG
jgi:hypothetical protein